MKRLLACQLTTGSIGYSYRVSDSVDAEILQLFGPSQHFEYGVFGDLCTAPEGQTLQPLQIRSHSFEHAIVDQR